jgi:hypothetical protein
MSELGLHGVLAGIYVLRGVDGAALEQIVQAVAAGYDGPDAGGLDVIMPNGADEAWLLLGRWTGCFGAEVQEAAELVLGRVREAIEAINAGMMRGGGEATVTVPSPYRIEVIPWIVVHGGIAEKITQARWLRWLDGVFPHVPSWVGMHMGAPHWLGVGVSLREGRIDQVTPYARLDLRADGMLMFTGVAEDSTLRAWLSQLKTAIGADEPERGGSSIEV